LVVQWLLSYSWFFWQSRDKKLLVCWTYIERVSYFGFIPLFLLCCIIFFHKRKETRIFGIVFLLPFYYHLIYWYKIFFRIPIPTLSTAVPTRNTWIISILREYSAAFDLSIYFKRRAEKIYQYYNTIFCYTILLWGLVLFTAKIFPQLSWH